MIIREELIPGIALQQHRVSPPILYTARSTSGGEKRAGDYERENTTVPVRVLIAPTAGESTKLNSI